LNIFLVYNMNTMLTIDSTYSLKRRGVLSTNDNSFLYNLYLPLIGYKALFIYEFLVNEYLSSIKDGKILYLSNKSNMTLSDFILSKKNLESVGLLQTLEDEDNYVFILKSVLNPNDFFENTVLKGLFVSKVGQDEAMKVMKYYEIDDVDFSKYVDISAGVKESFKIDFDEKDVNLNDNCKLIYVNKDEDKASFDDSKLIEYIAKKSNIDIREFTNEDIKEMHRLGSLYGLNEEIMGYIMIDAYKDDNAKGHKVDYAYCNKRCKTEISKYKAYNQKKYKNHISSNTKVANKINYYENTSPRIFLKEKQNGVEPISADLNIIDYLSQNMGLTDGIINVILDYSLMKLDDKLNRKYIEKIAATIKRKNLLSAVSAYDYLFNIDKKTTKVAPVIKDENKSGMKATKDMPNKSKENDDYEEVSVEELEKLL
jgi:replication initiation and membrane attachment protein